MKTTLALTAAAGLLLFTVSTGFADDSRYSPWQGQVQTGDMTELLKNLRALTDQAEQDKAADPEFLADLRSMASEYEDRARWPTRLLYDNFSDGNLTGKPTWTIVAGDWRVATNSSGTNALTSRVRKYGSYSSTSSTSNGTDIVAAVLAAVLARQNGTTTSTQQTQDAPASILVPVAISDQFSIRIEMASRESRGQFNYGVYAGQNGERSYQLAYLPGGANGLSLSRVTPQGSQLLATSAGAINLEDNQLHVIEWKRGLSGKMTVALDGQTVIEATDVGSRKPFTGFLMVNSGGNYAIQSVAINGTAK
jgi:hypothetical protein